MHAAHNARRATVDARAHAALTQVAPRAPGGRAIKLSSLLGRNCQTLTQAWQSPQWKTLGPEDGPEAGEPNSASPAVAKQFSFVVFHF